MNNDEKILRGLLWLHHGCQGLYGDDGEMQCAACMIDFKHDSVAEIERKLKWKMLSSLPKR